MTTEQDSFGPLCRLDQIREGEGRHARPTGGRWRNKAMAIFEENGQHYVTNFICPHSGGPMSEGKIENGIVECPWHGWKFNAATGLSEDAAGGHSIEVYETKVEGDTLMVGEIKKPS